MVNGICFKTNFDYSMCMFMIFLKFVMRRVMTFLNVLCLGFQYAIFRVSGFQ